MGFNFKADTFPFNYLIYDDYFVHLPSSYINIVPLLYVPY